MRLRPLIALLSLLLVAGCRFPWTGENGVLQLSGSLEANDVRVGSLIGGRVDSVFVAEGDSVRVGDRLVTLDAALTEAEIAEQRGRVSEARSKLDLARRGPRKEEIARAKIEYEHAESDRRRMEALLKMNAAAPQDYDSAAALAASRHETYLALENGTRPEEIAGALAAVTQTEGRLRYLERERKEAVVVAPVRGVVQTLDLRPGDLVAPRQTVAVVLEAAPAKVRVYVPEPRLGAIRVGQSVELRIDTYPDRVFPGRIVEISSEAEYMPRNIQTREQRNDQVFGVKIEVAPAPELKPGMSVTATIRPTESAR